MSTRRVAVAILSLALIGVLLTAVLVGCHAARQRGRRAAAPLSEEVRPSGGFASAADAASRPVIPDTHFMDVPDGEERRIDEPGSPLHGCVTLTRVMRTDISLYDVDKRFGRVRAERQQARNVYWAVESQDAYVYPDSTPQRPHTIPFTKVERFVAERLTADQVRRQWDAQARGVAEALRQYRQADPALELRLALGRADRRFVGVMGYALVVPGTGAEHQDLIDRSGVKVIPHTSDAVSGPEEAEFQDVARRFAAAYNRLLLKRFH